MLDNPHASPNRLATVLLLVLVAIAVFRDVYLLFRYSVAVGIDGYYYVLQIKPARSPRSIFSNYHTVGFISIDRPESLDQRSGCGSEAGSAGVASLTLSGCLRAAEVAYEEQCLRTLRCSDHCNFKPSRIFAVRIPE